MGSNPIYFGTPVERAGEITWFQERTSWFHSPEDRIALLSEMERKARYFITLFLFDRPIFFLVGNLGFLGGLSSYFSEKVSKSAEGQFGGKIWRGDSRVTSEGGEGRAGVARQRPSRNAAKRKGGEWEKNSSPRVWIWSIAKRRSRIRSNWASKCRCTKGHSVVRARAFEFSNSVIDNEREHWTFLSKIQVSRHRQYLVKQIHGGPVRHGFHILSKRGNHLLERATSSKPLGTLKLTSYSQVENERVDSITGTRLRESFKKTWAPLDM